MNKQAFRILLQRYLDGTTTAQEKQMVDFWFESLELEQVKDAKETDWEGLENRLWDKIYAETDDLNLKPQKLTKVISLWQRRYVKIAVVASMVLLLAFGSYFYYQITNHQDFTLMAGDMMTEENTSRQVKEIRLEDGSLVRLSPMAKLVYPKHFLAEKREVMLVGNAFFEVAHDADKPFFVIANQVITKVLGTSFYIKAAKNSKIEIEVKTGKVSVSEQKPSNVKNNGVILTPNQKVIYYTENKHFVTGLVEKPEVLSAEKEVINFDFKNEELQKVIEKLQNSYGIEIILENEHLGKCNLTGDLSKMSMFEQLDVISQTLGATYQIKGTTILLLGKGCEK